MRRRTAFTLVELLAAMAVLALLLLLLVQISDHTLQATRTSRQQISATQQARAVLDAMEADLASGIFENGLTLFAKSSGPHADTILAFLSRSRGPAGAADFRCAGVTYQLVDQEMRRGFSPVPWSQVDLVQGAITAATAPDASILARGILRFEVVAVLQNGETVPLTQGGSSTLFNQPVPDGFLALSLKSPPAPTPGQRVVALTVAVAAVDEQNLRLPGVADIGAKLGSPVAGQTPLELWKAAMAAGDLATIPRPALAALRMSQQTYPLE